MNVSAESIKEKNQNVKEKKKTKNSSSFYRGLRLSFFILEKDVIN